MTAFSPALRPVLFRHLAGLTCLLALALLALAAPGAGQEKKETKKDDKVTKADQDKKDTKKDDKETKKDDKGQKDTKKDDKTTKKDDKKPPEKKDERIYPKVDPVHEFKGHTDWVNRVSYVADDKFLVTAGRDKTLRIWEVGSGKEVLKIKDLPAPALALAVDAQGTKVVTTAGKWNKEKQVWTGETDIYDAKNGKLLTAIKGHSEPIEAVALSPDGTKVVTASNDGTAKVWDLAGKELLTLKGHTGPVAAVAYSP